jgi:hypothetical protein
VSEVASVVVGFAAIVVGMISLAEEIVHHFRSAPAGILLLACILTFYLLAKTGGDDEGSET